MSGEASVVDGNTLVVGGVELRLYGADAPGIAQSCSSDGRPYECGRQAASALLHQIAGRTVSCTGRAREEGGRVLAVCAIYGDEINAWMVAQGWALADRRQSGAYARLEDEAKAARNGLWRGEFAYPWGPPRQGSGDTGTAGEAAPEPPGASGVTPTPVQGAAEPGSAADTARPIPTGGPSPPPPPRAAAATPGPQADVGPAGTAPAAAPDAPRPRPDGRRAEDAHPPERAAGLGTPPAAGPEAASARSALPSPPPAGARELRADELFAKVSDTVWLVVAAKLPVDPAAGLSRGSAVAVDGRRLLTSCRLVDGQDAVVVGQGTSWYKAELVAADRAGDRCVLASDEAAVNATATIRPAESLRVGEKTYAIGAPQGLDKTLGEGVVSGLRTVGGVAYVQTTTPASRSSSGGGLFDGQGNLVGITDLAGRGDPSLAIAADSFDHLAAAPGVPPTASPKRPTTAAVGFRRARAQVRRRSRLRGRRAGRDGGRPRAVRPERAAGRRGRRRASRTGGRGELEAARPRAGGGSGRAGAGGRGRRGRAAGRAAGRFAIHVASVRDPSRVAEEWRRLAERHPGLAGLALREPRTVEVPGRGRYYRVVAGGVRDQGRGRGRVRAARAGGAGLPGGRVLRRSAGRGPVTRRGRPGRTCRARRSSRSRRVDRPRGAPAGSPTGAGHCAAGAGAAAARGDRPAARGRPRRAPRGRGPRPSRGPRHQTPVPVDRASAGAQGRGGDRTGPGGAGLRPSGAPARCTADGRPGA